MIETIKATRDNKELYEAILTNLSKTFDFIYHDLLIDKFNAYGFDWNALNDSIETHFSLFNTY